MTHQYIFNYKQKDIYWCTADIGWVTGHSYIIYGPLANGATTRMFEGIPNYPDSSRWWQIIDKYKVNTFYTANSHSRKSSTFSNKILIQNKILLLHNKKHTNKTFVLETFRWKNKTLHYKSTVNTRLILEYEF